MGRPKGSKNSKSSGIQVTAWNHKSQMDPKFILGDQYDPSKHYRFVRKKDRAEFMQQAHGYTSTGKDFKELALMWTSKEHARELQAQKQERTRIQTEAADRSVEREVNQAGQVRGKSMVYFTKG